jgi:hypothetical protein
MSNTAGIILFASILAITVLLLIISRKNQRSLHPVIAPENRVETSGEVVKCKTASHRSLWLSYLVYIRVHGYDEQFVAHVTIENKATILNSPFASSKQRPLNPGDRVKIEYDRITALARKKRIHCNIIDDDRFSGKPGTVIGVGPFRWEVGAKKPPQNQ